MITNKYHRELAKLNKKDLDKVLRKYRNKIIIFVGFFHGGFNSLWSKVKHGYLIKVDAQTLWTRYNLRTIKCLHDNYKNIVKLFQSKTHFSKIHKILSVLYGIRNGFDCVGVNKMKLNINKFKSGKYNDNELKDIIKNLQSFKISKGSIMQIKPFYVHSILAITDIKLIESSTLDLDDVFRLFDETGRGHGKINSEHM